MAKLSIDQWVHDAMLKHHSKYDYSEVSYATIHDKVTIICPVHGKFIQSANDHRRGRGCSQCGRISAGVTSRLTTDQYIQKAIAKHGMRYDYRAVNYQTAKQKIKIMCNIHGGFLMLPSLHLYGYNCPTCSRRHAITTTEFISMAHKVHGDEYDYSNSEYCKNNQEISIICKYHGEFFQTPNNHLTGYGCTRCGYEAVADKLTMNNDEFVGRAIRVHGDRYDYVHSTYVRHNIPVAIGCDTHGEFLQTPANHLRGYGCHKCNCRMSLPSQAWLDSVGIPDDPSHREVGGLIYGRNYVVDGYDPETNTVYEFHGDYWHGNPRIYESDDINPTTKTSYGHLYALTTAKRDIFKINSFKYIEQWESDWNNGKI